MRIMASLLLLLAVPALATPLPPVLQKFVEQGGSVGQNFSAPDGLTGWVIKLQGRYMVIYTTASGDYAIGGVLMDKDGKSLTQQYADKYIPKPDAAKLAAGLSTDSMLVDEGDPHAPVLYVYADPNCSYCNKLWNDLRPFVESGKVRVRWALVDFLKPSSPGRAAAVLVAKDRGAALAEDETRFDRDHEEGGIPALAAVPAETSKTLAAHREQMQEAGGFGTPTLVMRRAGNWDISYGLPKNLQALVNSLDK